MCDEGCMNGGTCIAPNICSCTANWRGAQCEEGVCVCVCVVCVCVCVCVCVQACRKLSNSGTANICHKKLCIQKKLAVI